MTASNHALTGAVIALAVKNPALAIPMAFISHFVVDVIPHYNPKGVKGFYKTREKFKHRSFRLIFSIDMLIWPVLLITLPFVLVADVSSWTIFLCMLVAVSPDFVEGFYFLAGAFGKKIIKPTRFDRFSLGIKIYERPRGLVVEIAWLLVMVWLISRLADL